MQQIGSFAWDALQHGSAAVVMGVTSRGAFVQVDGRRVIFLSTESDAGPLTLNCSAALHVAVGAQAVVDRGILCFEKGGCCIDATRAVVWTLPEPSGKALLASHRRDILEQVVRKVFSSPDRPKGGFSAWLATLIHQPTARAGSSDIPEEAFFRLRQEWRLALRAGSISPALVASLVSFLGMGVGLTPSGDDLVAGLLLALNRWGNALAPYFPVQELNEVVLVAASQATTALSASLLECAAAGQADPRLVEALDGLVTGQPGPDIILDRVYAYGATSGLDSLVGFSQAVI